MDAGRPMARRRIASEIPMDPLCHREPVFVSRHFACICRARHESHWERYRCHQKSSQCSRDQLVWKLRWHSVTLSLTAYRSQASSRGIAHETRQSKRLFLFCSVSFSRPKKTYFFCFALVFASETSVGASRGYRSSKRQIALKLHHSAPLISTFDCALGRITGFTSRDHDRYQSITTYFRIWTTISREQMHEIMALALTKVKFRSQQSITISLSQAVILRWNRFRFDKLLLRCRPWFGWKRGRWYEPESGEWWNLTEWCNGDVNEGIGEFHQIKATFPSGVTHPSSRLINCAANRFGVVNFLPIWFLKIFFFWIQNESATAAPRRFLLKQRPNHSCLIAPFSFKSKIEFSIRRKSQKFFHFIFSLSRPEMSFVSLDFYQICNRNNNIASPLTGSFGAKVLLSSGILPNYRSIPLADY